MKQITRHITTFIYGHIAKPLFFHIRPDTVHERMFHAARLATKLRFINPILSAVWAHKNDQRLTQTVFGMKFANPVGLSAGFDKNAEMIPTFRAIGFGFATTGSISADAASGNPRPWYFRLPRTKSLVVNAGLPNQGTDRINARILNYPSGLFENFPLVASVAKTNSPKTSTDLAGIADYVEGVRKMQHNPKIAMFEINISCPNAFGGESFTRPGPLEELLTKLDALGLMQPVAIKMPIDKSWADFNALLQVILKHNVAAVTIGNLQKDRGAVKLQDPLPDDVKGNLSGKPCFEKSNDLIARTYKAYGDQLIIIGVGGIFDANDAYEKIKHGATLVELITGMIFGGPQTIGQINHDLSQLLASDGYGNVTEAVGAYYRSKNSKK